MRGVVNRFLLWAPPATLGTYLVVLTVAGTAAPSNNDAKAFLANQLTMLRAVINAPYLAAWIIGLLLLWLSVYLSSMESKQLPATATPRNLIVLVREFIDRHIHHKETQAETKPVTSLSAKLINAQSPDRAFIGTPGAALFGLNAAKSYAVIDLKNFGRTAACNVTWKATAGWFDKQPDEAAFDAQGQIGVTEPGHAQHIMLILTRPVTSEDVRHILRGGAGFYAIVRIDYTDITGAEWSRRFAYYLDPDRPRDVDRWMLSSCPNGNDEFSR